MSPTNRIARWDGTEWRSLGGGIQGSTGIVLGMTVFDGLLYVVGAFSQVGNVAASNIAAWNGSEWFPVAGGTDGAISAIAVYNGHLVIGGSFEHAGGNIAHRIAILNPGGWSPMGAGMYEGDFEGNNIASVAALTVHGGDLVAGGAFERAGNVDATNIARWNGIAWSAIGQGIGQSDPYDEDQVSALASTGGILYAGGTFMSAGGDAAANFASWDGTAWSEVGGGIDGYLRCLLPMDGGVVVGGRFDTAGDTPTRDIAFWDGQAWSTFASGLTSLAPGRFHAAYALTQLGGDLFAGGQFTCADPTASSNIASWRSIPSDAGEDASGIASHIGLPNPYRPGASIRLMPRGVWSVDERRLEILDVQGRHLRDLTVDGASGTTRWDGRAENGRDVPEGTYFVRVRQGRSWSVRKIILDR
jgi:hypothetical protein